MNREEAAMENRTDDLRRKDSAKDPRPIPGAPGESTTFTRSSNLVKKEARRKEWNSFL